MQLVARLVVAVRKFHVNFPAYLPVCAFVHLVVFLAGVPDGALQIDRSGFNRFFTMISPERGGFDMIRHDGGVRFVESFKQRESFLGLAYVYALASDHVVKAGVDLFQ